MRCCLVSELCRMAVRSRKALGKTFGELRRQSDLGNENQRGLSHAPESVPPRA